MDKIPRLYLFTLEVAPLELGKTYNPLPSHLTIISRFYSVYSPVEIADRVSGVLAQFKKIKLVFNRIEVIGPKQTEAHIIQPDKALLELHAQLARVLDGLGVTYTQPEYIGSGWRPHVSTRDDDTYTTSSTVYAKSVYLIEVSKVDDKYMRTIRNQFNFAF